MSGEMLGKIASYLWQYRDNPPTHDLEALRRASQILSFETTNGHSIKEMVEFFEKIDHETQREAVVEREGELPPNPFFGRPPSEGTTTQWYGANAYMEAVKCAGWVKEV